ncbi:phosphatase PAP2 family protein [Gemella sp. zg-1178]|uniref:phosphatase PAP2 family protein n=1 Tax=Gemella sp. zg-1178 TaxID=2840372 RepID=UPI001C04C019|nr:phosphatase PAP2 family protein [Gemella sp. zg-1178]MBU0278573.1 phosphatase PAP2 family protein [Gemella sp. zg-1178]
MKNKNLYLLSLISSLPFFIIILFGLGEPSNNKWQIDNKIWSYILEIRNINMTKIIVTITHMGGSLFLTILVLVVCLILILKKELKLAIFLAMSSLLGAFFLNRILKYIFARPRPYSDSYIENLISVKGYSFPSGHAMASAIIYILLAYILTKNIKNKKIILFIYSLAIIFSLFICFTRIYLGVHYPTDLIAGFSMGLSWAILSILIYKRWLSNES